MLSNSDSSVTMFPSKMSSVTMFPTTVSSALSLCFVSFFSMLPSPASNVVKCFFSVAMFPNSE